MIFSITDRMARNDLKELINKNIIERKGVSDKMTYYILAEIISASHIKKLKRHKKMSKMNWRKPIIAAGL